MCLDDNDNDDDDHDVVVVVVVIRIWDHVGFQLRRAFYDCNQRQRSPEISHGPKPS